MSEHWSAIWGCPITRPHRYCAEWMKDVTIRMVVTPTVPGSSLKLHFSNLFGKEATEITRVTVGYLKNKTDMERAADVTFGGGATGTLAAGGALVSDPVRFSFAAGQKLVVNLYFEQFTYVSTAQTNAGPFIWKWAASGDQTHNAELPLNQYAEAELYPFIHLIEADTVANAYSIVAFGDSITAQSWPDHLANRLLEMGRNNVSVIRRGIGGGRVLREYSCAMYQQYGPKGLDRFRREVAVPGVKKVFILHGINDIIHPEGVENNPFRPMSDLPAPQELIAGYQQYIQIARELGVELYLSPILPFNGWRTYNDRREEIRLAVNEWIRGEAQIDGLLPFADTVADPADPLRLKAEYDSGDHLHPSVAGARAMARSIPAEWL